MLWVGGSAVVGTSQGGFISADAEDPQVAAVGGAVQIADGVPHAEFETVEGGFHFLSLTNADAVTPRLRTFLTGV